MGAPAAASREQHRFRGIDNIAFTPYKLPTFAWGPHRGYRASKASNDARPDHRSDDVAVHTNGDGEDDSQYRPNNEGVPDALLDSGVLAGEPGIELGGPNEG